MGAVELDLLPLLSGRRAVAAWMVGSFLATFLVTRFLTRAIRAGRGPFRNVSMGGMHVHHGVYGIFLMLGANPFDADRAAGELPLAVTVAVNLVLAVVAVVKGRAVLGVLGVFVPVVAVVAACRLARPASPSARRRYPAGSRRVRRSRDRFPPGRRTRWDALVDLFATAPRAGPAKAPSAAG